MRDVEQKVGGATGATNFLYAGRHVYVTPCIRNPGGSPPEGLLEGGPELGGG